MFMRKTLVAIKKETTYGVDSTPTGAECFLVRNVNLTPIAGDTAKRDLVRPFFGNSETIQVNQRTELTFEIELQSSGTAGTAPAFKDALKGVGFAETLTAGSKAEYSLISGSFDSNTIKVFIDGVLHTLLGARGTVSAKLSKGAIPTLSFNFMGRYAAPSDAAMLTPDYSKFQKPVGANSINTPTVMLHGQSLVMDDFSFDLANNMVFRDLPGGASQALITNRSPSGSIVFEAGLMATKNWFEAARTTEAGELQIIHGISAGFIVQIDAPNAQIETPSYSDVDGVVMLNAKLGFIPGSSGNDELKLTFK